MTAGSVLAMARNTIPPAAFAKVRRRRISSFRPTSLFPTPRFKSAERNVVYSRFNHERTLDLPTAEQISAMVRETTAGWRSHSFFFRRLSGTTQLELPVDLRRHSCVHAR